MPSVRPFPWGTLDALSRDDAAATRGLHRYGRAIARPQEVARALAEILEARVEIAVRRVRSRAKAPRGEDGVGVVLAPSDAPEIARAALFEVEPALAAALVARALRRGAPRVVAPASSGEGLAGAVGAVLLATARRVSQGRALRILAAGPARTLERDLASASGALVEASLTVLLNDDAFAARIAVPRAVALATPAPRWTRADLAALGDVPLPLAIVAAVSESTAAMVGSLRRGDAWVLGAWELEVTARGELTGPVVLAAPAFDRGVRATLGAGARLVLREGIAEVGVSGGESAERGGGDALVEAVGEVPVVVRVELGAIEMRAREWASLSAGDVVTLAKKIGEPVTLRVGGVTVARGELVDLDGEIAVRILGRTNGPHATDAR